MTTDQGVGGSNPSWRVLADNAQIFSKAVFTSILLARTIATSVVCRAAETRSFRESLWLVLARYGYGLSSRLGGLLLPYEAFCGGEPSTEAIADYLELKLDPAVMTRRIGSQEKKTPLSPQQIRRLQRVVDPLAAQLGYTAPES